MSRILLLIEPVEGHFNPCVPIMQALTAAGHQLVCVTGRKFAAQVERTGARFVALPPQWDVGEQEIYDFFPALQQLTGLAQIKFYIKHIMYAQIPDVLQTLHTILKEFPAEVVIGDTFMMAGAWLSELGGPPSVRLSVLPLSLPSPDIAPFGLGLLPSHSWATRVRNRLLNRLFEQVLFRDVQRHVNRLRQQLGLPAYRNYVFISALESHNLVLHTSTPRFEYPRKALPANFRYIGPILVPPKADFAKPLWWEAMLQNPEVPVVLINQGTVAKNYADLILPALAGLSTERLFVIALPVKEGELIDLPANAHTAAYIPFADLLPHVTVMLSNGGFGGVQNALAHGIPLVIAGATEDKMEVAARVEYAGAGINLRKQQPSAAEIRQAVLRVLAEPSYKQHAQQVQQDFAQYAAPELALQHIAALIACR